jgi:hypothetical protein
VAYFTEPLNQEKHCSLNYYNASAKRTTRVNNTPGDAWPEQPGGLVELALVRKLWISVPGIGTNNFFSL